MSDENKKIDVGLIGCGVVGNALKVWLEENNKDVAVKVSDPAKGMADNIQQCSIYFIQIPVPTQDNGFQDATMLLAEILKLPDNVPVFIRSTITPQLYFVLKQYLKDQQAKKNIRLYYMPEYLSERTAEEDFAKQILVCTAETDEDEKLFAEVFKGKDYIKMNSVEAILAKYFHNVFGALKVTYFNCVHDICTNGIKSVPVDYKKVLAGMYVSRHIDLHYTDVPGHDGKLGYGGKCFPKDLKAIERELRYTPFGRLIDQVQKLNDQFRENK